MPTPPGRGVVATGLGDKGLGGRDARAVAASLAVDGDLPDAPVEADLDAGDEV